MSAFERYLAIRFIKEFRLEAEKFEGNYLADIFRSKASKLENHYRIINIPSGKAETKQNSKSIFSLVSRFCGYAFSNFG